MEEAMSEKLSTDMIVDIIEATVRVLVGLGLSRDEALQVMLSQMAAQVSPDVMQIAAKLNAEYHKDFEKANWTSDTSSHDDSVGHPDKVGSAEFALGPL
jgi:hypothetical protein